MSYFCVPCFVVVLSSPDHMPVLQVYEHAEDAISQAHAWLRDREPCDQTTPGFVLFLSTADKRTTVAVSRHVLELDDPVEDWTDPAAAASSGSPVRTLRSVPRPKVDQEGPEPVAQGPAAVLQAMTAAAGTQARLMTADREGQP